jgi:selenocysteine lyase/cysteine desulfurase
MQMSAVKSNGGSGVSRRGFLGGSLAALAAGVAAPSPELEAAAAAPSWRERVQAPGMPDAAYWQRVRREFNFVDDVSYMNTGTMGPIPTPVVDAQTRYLRELAADPHARRDLEPIRDKLAAFVGADPDEILFTRSTTEGMKVFCRGLDLAPGDEVLMSTHEHPGGYGPWRAREDRDGVVVRTVDIPAPPESAAQVIDICERAIRPETKVLVVSYPIFVTGLLMPIAGLAEMAHRHDVLLSVDGAHALGMLDLDMHAMGCDHFTTSGQKWLLAGSGTGMAYFSRGVQDRVWRDIALDPEIWRVWPGSSGDGARKYEASGQRHLPSLWGMGDALDFHLAIGKANIERRIRRLATRLKDGLAAIPGAGVGTSGAAELSGGLTTFWVDGVPKANLTKALMDRERIYLPGGRLNDYACRCSTHFFNTEDDVDRVLEVVRHVAGNRGMY